MPRSSRAFVLAAVAAGGALGTIGRYELSLAEPIVGGRFPWTTLAVNLAGSLLLGVVLAALADRSTAPVWRPFLAVGVCGGLTTFSTWMMESVLLTRDGHGATAALYLAVSLALGFGAIVLGVFGTRAVLGRHGPIVFDPAEDD